MNEQELRNVVLTTLGDIAPEVDGETLKDDTPLRNQVDLDSMDWLNFLIGLHKKLGVDIPESDYAGLITLENILKYLSVRLP
ncbi:MAG: acyl carrier protein [Methylococcaceae bacterium]|jgi:acyl carrier protein|nr:acyl carrier protein [Methylococcaceae bacterium]